MSRTFIFQTGHGKGLAKAEILSLLPGSIIDEVEDGFVVEAEIENPTSLLNRMGGIVRIGEVLNSGPSRMPLNFEAWVVNAIETNVKDTSAKIRYGLSVHPRSEKILKKCLIGAKKSLKKSVGNVRFVNKDFQNLSSVQAWHERLLSENAIELHLFKGKDKWYMCKTLAIQNFEWYSKRDYDRPAKSAKNGMFPPKLAQILINLSGATDMVFDPFCGSGTVLQEAALMGLRAWGSDLSEDMVADTQTNLKWLEETMNKQSILKMENVPHVFQADATQLTKDQVPTDLDFTIVTETWLGPALTQPLTELERHKLHREIETLYDKFFTNIRPLLEAPVTMVFTAPYHREGNTRHFLPNLPSILEEHCEIIPLSDHERPSLFYERKNQLVSREIWKVRIKK